MIKKIFAILLIMSILILMSINVFCHEGLLDSSKGHFVQKDGVAVAYHYHDGINTGYELIFNKFIKWDNRDEITIPSITDNSLGEWKQFAKDYKIKLVGVCDPTSKNIEWVKSVKLDNNNIEVDKDYNSKKLEISIDIKGYKEIFGTKTLVYEGVLTQKLNETGHTIISVDAKNKLNQSESYKFTFKFESSYSINFNINYVALQEPSIEPSAETSVEPSTSPSPETSKTPNNKTLPKTGESSNTILIIGALICVIGVGIALRQLKNKILD